MKHIYLTIIFVLFIIFVRAQYISEVIEYVPAPGQFINTDSYGSPAAAQSIIGGRNGIVSLGAFGGFIIFKFGNPVENNPENPFGIDFTIFGNPSADRSEPGIIYVMKDENNNGLADDTWYELAGSDFYFSSTIRTYEITYTNPHQSVAADVPWADNQDSSGFVFANEYHTQAYYPTSENFSDIDQDYYTLSGTKITAAVDLSDPAFIRSHQRVFGYADNQLRGDANSMLPDNPYTEVIEYMGGDAFDISWAVDETGNYIDLNEIDFVKVQCSVNADLAWLGELSTEISGAVDIAPDASVNGPEDLLVIKDLPSHLAVNSSYQLESFAFHLGRLLADQNIIWSVDLPGASIDENNILTVNQTGTLTLTASFEDNTTISTSITVQVSEPEELETIASGKFNIYPNPTNQFIQIRNAIHVTIEILNNYGSIVKKIQNYSETDKIDVSSFLSGIYFVKIHDDSIVRVKKVIINN